MLSTTQMSAIGERTISTTEDVTTLDYESETNEEITYRETIAATIGRITTDSVFSMEMSSNMFDEMTAAEAFTTDKNISTILEETSTLAGDRSTVLENTSTTAEDTIADETSTVLDETSTVADETSTVLDETSTVADETNTVVEDTSTTEAESSTILVETTQVIDLDIPVTMHLVTIALDTKGGIETTTSPISTYRESTKSDDSDDDITSYATTSLGKDAINPTIIPSTNKAESTNEITHSSDKGHESTSSATTVDSDVTTENKEQTITHGLSIPVSCMSLRKHFSIFYACNVFNY